MPCGSGIFNALDPDEAKRDAQTAELKKWYPDNEARLTWDDARHKLALKPTADGGQ